MMMFEVSIVVLLGVILWATSGFAYRHWWLKRQAREAGERLRARLARERVVPLPHRERVDDCGCRNDVRKVKR